MVKQIALNLYGTVLPLSGEPVLRKGFEDFVKRNLDKSLVLYSREEGHKSLEDLKKSGLENVELYDHKKYLAQAYQKDMILLYGLDAMEKWLPDSFIPEEYKKEAMVYGKYISDWIYGKKAGQQKYILLPPVYLFPENSHDGTIMISSFDIDAKEVWSKKVYHTLLVPVFENQADTFSFDKVHVNRLRYPLKNFFFKKSSKID